MPDPNARERAAFRLVEGLTPAFALGIECPECRMGPGHHCGIMEPVAIHAPRLAAARSELHSLLLTLGIGT